MIREIWIIGILFICSFRFYDSSFIYLLRFMTLIHLFIKVCDLLFICCFRICDNSFIYPLRFVTLFCHLSSMTCGFYMLLRVCEYLLLFCLWRFVVAIICYILFSFSFFIVLSLFWIMHLFWPIYVVLCHYVVF